MDGEEGIDCADGDLGGGSDWIAINASGDTGEGDEFAIVFQGNGERVAVACGEFF